MRFPRVVGVAAVLLALSLTACDSTPSPVFTPDPDIVPPSATPVPGANGTVAVLVTNTDRTGSTYDVVLLDASGVIRRRVTAKLPVSSLDDGYEFPLVSASDNLVYYLDGNTDIRSTGISGPSDTLVHTISAGAKASIGFAVSADNSKIAISVMSAPPDVPDSTGHGYVEDLAGSGHHVDLFSNTGDDSYRYPVGWQDENIVDAIRPAYCAQDPMCAGSYHVINSVNGQRAATVCETSTSSSSEDVDDLAPSGAPTAAGTACTSTHSTMQETLVTTMSVNWAGAKHQFVAPANSDVVSQCFLSPDGTEMICDGASNDVTVVHSDGTTKDLGLHSSIYGWIDSKHVLLAKDANTLGIVSPDTGAEVSVPFPGAFKAELMTTMPGGF